MDQFISIINTVIYLTKNSNLDVIEAGPWMIDDIIFYKKIKESLPHCMNLFMAHSPNLAIIEIVSSISVINLYCLQSIDIERF